MNRNVLAILFLGLTVIIAWHLDWHRKFDVPAIVGISPKKSNTAKETLTLGAYINQLERRHFDEQGILTSRVHTEHAFQYQNTPDLLHLEQPVFYFFSDNTLWRGESNSAIANLQSELTALYENVAFSRVDDPLLIRSEQLNVDSKLQTAYTDKRVKINNPNSQTEAVGMKVHLDTETLQLNSYVHTLYQSPPNH